MKSIRRTFAYSLVVLTVGTTPALGQDDHVEEEQTRQEHVIDRSELRASVAEKAAEVDRQRETVLRVLQHEDVRAVADEIGVDLRTVEDAVFTLEESELQRLADQAGRIDKALVAGDTVTISTTAIIIGLLILIFILVA